MEVMTFQYRRIVPTRAPVDMAPSNTRTRPGRLLTKNPCRLHNGCANSRALALASDPVSGEVIGLNAATQPEHNRLLLWPESEPANEALARGGDVVEAAPQFDSDRAGVHRLHGAPSRLKRKLARVDGLIFPLMASGLLVASVTTRSGFGMPIRDSQQKYLRDCLIQL